MSIANPFARMKAVTAALLAALVLSVMSMAPAAAGPAGWAAVKNGTTFVIMRHALAPGTGDPEGFRLEDCATQRNLSAEGRAQARAAGRRLAEAGLAEATVLSSRWCRSLETSRVATRKSLASTPSVHSWLMGSSWPYSWPMVIDFGFMV